MLSTWSTRRVQMTDKVMCPCGGRFTPKHTWWHKHNSKRHLDWMLSQPKEFGSRILGKHHRSLFSTLPKHKPDLSLDNPKEEE